MHAGAPDLSMSSQFWPSALVKGKKQNENKKQTNPKEAGLEIDLKRQNKPSLIVNITLS